MPLGTFLQLLKYTVSDQPTVDNWEVSRRRHVAVAVGCLHFNGTSLHVCLLVANFADERGQTDRQKDRQTDRKTDRQRDIHTDRETD